VVFHCADACEERDHNAEKEKLGVKSDECS
jgi:hypothetical protein